MPADPSRRAEPLLGDSPLAPFWYGDARRATFALRPPSAVPLPYVDGLLAGAAEVDLTPPPGLPKAGYSSHAHIGDGFRTRLRARVLHLRSGTTSLAIVQCDLLGGSSVVHHLVARAVAERTDIPVAGLMIGATHTHAGPGQFLGTDFYNRFASSRSGFDPVFAAWLAERIAGAVVEAHDTRRPARLAVGSTEVWGLTRNRSLSPHVRNDEIIDRRTAPQRKWVSINPQLHLIRVDTIGPGDGDDAAGAGGPAATTPLAAVVVFSVHGTGISMHAPEYNADLWAYLVGELDHRIEATHGHRAICGAIEGTHADVAPALRPTRAGHVEAQRIGRAIGAEAAALHDRLGLELRDDLPLATGLRELDLDRPGATTIDDVSIPRRPAVGAALIAGAHENVTPVLWRIPPFKAGSPKPWRSAHPQGRKWVVGTRWLQPVVLPLAAFPRVVPISVLRLGDAVLVGMPFEITVMSGRRIAAAVAAAGTDAGIDLDADRVIVSSVAGEYYGYLATPEEYDLQFYEGGHTLYGRPAQPFFTRQAAALARLVLAGGGSGTVADCVAERRFDLKVRRFVPPSLLDGGTDAHDAADAVERAELTPARFVEPTPDDDGCWELEWVDAAPDALAWHEPMARVECSDDGGHTWRIARSRDGMPVDDQRWQLEVRHRGPLPDARDITAGDDAGGRAAPTPHRYSVRWYDPTFRTGRIHRFVLCANAGRPELATTPFD